MYQKIAIIGNLGSDPEMRYFDDGNAMTNFSVATSRKWRDGNGNEKEETTWFRVTTNGKTAEACNQFLTKGSKVFVEGRWKPDPNTGSPKIWSKQDGTSGASFEIVANEVKFLSGRNDTPADGQTPARSTNAQHAGTQPHQTVAEDDIPF